jgi:phage-related minor tail protein
MTELLVLVLLHAAPVPIDQGPATAVLIDCKQSPVYLQQQVALLKSEPILRLALARPEVAKLDCVKKQADALNWLKAKLRVEAQESKGTISVWLADGSRREQATLVDGLVNSFLEEMLRRRKALLERSLSQKLKHRDEAQVRLTRYRQEEAMAHEAEAKEIAAQLRRGEEAGLRGIDYTIALIRKELSAPYRLSVIQKASADP